MGYIILVLGILTMAGSTDSQIDSLGIGSKAPDFSLPYATRDSVAKDNLTLSDVIGAKNIILAFYPADWSGGCTREVCTFRDNFAALSGLNVEVLGISGDYEYSHHEWAQFHNLPFKLLADHSHDVAKRYDSYNDVSGFNRRTVYVIDKKGTIAYIDLKYSTRDMESFHKLQKALRELK